MRMYMHMYMYIWPFAIGHIEYCVGKYTRLIFFLTFLKTNQLFNISISSMKLTVTANVCPMRIILNDKVVSSIIKRFCGSIFSKLLLKFNLHVFLKDVLNFA